jgi:LmbE family N-acetylglucosaminyl deacetylase
MAVPGGLALAGAALLAVMGGVACDRGGLRAALTPALVVDRDTRLLVFAPHPDDEVLAAGGLIQQVRKAGGIVHVVYLTSGDAYIESVKIEEHVANPTTKDYRDYGQHRESEARMAMRTLGVGAWSLTFLGFPNAGLNRLMSTYWSERQSAYRSPYTRRQRPAQSERFIPDTEYRGEDLTQELAEIIGDFRPTLILVPRSEEQNGDHCATWFFVADALGDVTRVQPRFRTDLVSYIVHYNAWPLENDDPVLKPPDDLDAGVSGWMTVLLTDQEVAAKREAVHKYQTQMNAMGWFLDGFVRRNEVFSRPAPPHVALPVAHSVCDQFEDPPRPTKKP